jgi:ubiquinone/menaquinone biosynthesis C-methylase UbiE
MKFFGRFYDVVESKEDGFRSRFRHMYMRVASPSAHRIRMPRSAIDVGMGSGSMFIFILI